MEGGGGGVRGGGAGGEEHQSGIPTILEGLS